MKRDFDKKFKNKKDKSNRLKFDFEDDYTETQNKKHSPKKKKFRNVEKYEIEDWI